MATMHLPPFRKEDQLCNDLDGPLDGNGPRLPGSPCVHLSDRDEVAEYLHRDLVAEDLEAAASMLWIMTTQSHDSINALHCQLVKGRQIQITEDPRLHLVWSHDRIFIKPLPRYLLSHHFWTQFILQQHPAAPANCVRRASTNKCALGFLRTYAHLVKHESDFIIAQRSELRLLPPDITWQAFCDYIADFRHLCNSDVSSRYYYGELRQSRLNLYACVLFRKISFERIQWEYSDYFARFFAPILFGFAILSIILNGMQVVLQVEQLQPSDLAAHVWSACRWFAVLSILAAAATGTLLLIIWLCALTNEWIFAIRERWRKRCFHPKRR